MEINAMKLFKAIFGIFSVAIFATLLGCASTPTREGTGEYVDDTVITTKVKAAIFAEPTLKSTEINVETFKGAVQLSGFVRSEADTQKAVEVTRKIKGVESVKNDMRVKGR
jgi:osmotically-inducible protein OsmY